jgi:hypothetical protein
MRIDVLALGLLCHANNSWWQWLDLNQRPKAYESSALPLSYTARTLTRDDYILNDTALTSIRERWCTALRH